MMRLAMTGAAALLLVAACGKDNTTMDMTMTNKDMAPDMSVPPDMTIVPPTFDVPAGCATATVGLSSFYTNIISNTCAQANCHVSGGIPPLMGPGNMAMFKTNVIGVSAGRTPSSLKLVATNDLNNSFLIYKITGQQTKVQSGGSQMPNNLAALTATQQCQIVLEIVHDTGLWGASKRARD